MNLKGIIEYLVIMITWILGGILIVWCIIRRLGRDGKVEGQPLGMPRGTVRAWITILIVSFPFNYLLLGQQIPGLITNAIFIVVAFYFEARRGSKDKLRIIEEIKYPDETKVAAQKEKKPLYLPKFSVRIIIISILASILITNTLGPNVPFEITNTLVDLLIIIFLFIIGSFFRVIKNSKEKNRLTNQIKSIENYISLSEYEILENIEKREPSWWEQKSKNLLSLLILAAVITALLCYTIAWDLVISVLPFYDFSLRETLLLLISVYYGFRD